LVSDDNKEFEVNEEGINNSTFLQRHKQYNNQKIPLKYHSDVVEFLANVLNDPLKQEERIKEKINRLQKEDGNNCFSLAEYAAGLKELGVNIKAAIQQMEKAEVVAQNTRNSDDNSYDNNDGCSCFCLSSALAIYFSGLLFQIAKMDINTVNEHSKQL